jgi:hypothetical protein
MDSQDLITWNRRTPVGTAVLAKLPAGDPRRSPLPTKTRSSPYMLNGAAVVMVSGISSPVALADVTYKKDGYQFPIALTTLFMDQEHLGAFEAAVAAINAENVDLHIEEVENHGDGSGWVTISASSPNRIFHLGARVGKWLVEEKGALQS